MKNLSEIQFIHWSNSIQSTDYDVKFVNNLINGTEKTCVKLLDIGGGNGSFADKISGKAKVTVVDKSQLAADGFISNPDVTLAFEDFFTFTPDSTFDYILFKTVLHHFIGATETATLDLQTRALEKAASMLSTNGRLVIEENFYQGVFGSDITARTIFWLTRSQLFAPLFRKLGANTAGEGVRFRSFKSWEKIFSDQGFEVDLLEKSTDWAKDFPWWQRLPLLCIDRYQAILVLRPTQ